MISADAETVAVAAGYDDRQVVVRQLDPGGHGQRSAVQRVHPVGVDESWKIGRTADTADCDHVVVCNLQFDQRLLDRGQHSEIATSGTPVGIDFAFQVGQGYMPGGLQCGCHMLFSSTNNFTEPFLKPRFHASESKAWSCRPAAPLLLRRCDEA